jgi:hypothetical protein
VRCFDFDDFAENNHKLDRLHELKTINPGFRCTVFAIPGLGSDSFWAQVPRWIELAVHGWRHPDPYECVSWGHDDLRRCLDQPVVRTHFVNGFKAPGWQISDACYEVLLERGYWVADQHLEDQRRPAGLRTYLHEDGGWHGHIQDVCGNGIEETWPRLVQAVHDETEFRFASELAR